MHGPGAAPLSGMDDNPNSEIVYHVFIRNPEPMPTTEKAKTVKDARASLYREIILKAGEEVFSRVGYASARVRDIAAEAGISLTTFYAVFPGKKELFRAIGEARHDRLITDLRSINDESESPLHALKASIAAAVDFYAERPALLQVLLRDGRNWAEDASLPEDERESWHAGIAQFRSIFARGVAEGVFVSSDPALMARVVAAVLQVHLAHWLDHDQTCSPRLAEQVQSVIVRAYQTDAAIDGSLDPESRGGAS